MKIVKNFGINIPASIEKMKRSLQHAPSMRLDNFANQAKKDFEYYNKPTNRRHPDYR